MRKIRIGDLKRLIREMATRTPRNPAVYQCVTEWGFTHVPWPEFVQRFPEDAAQYVENYLEGWTDEEIAERGGGDPLTWPALWDDEAFLDRDGNPIILANISGPGGSLWMMHEDEEWDEVVLDDDGNVEVDY